MEFNGTCPNINSNEISLPNELLTNIMGRLDKVSLGKCQLVSKQWLEVSSDNNLWRAFLAPNFATLEGINAQKIIASSYITSPQQLIERIREVAAKIPLYDHGRFHVEFTKDRFWDLLEEVVCEIDIQYGKIDLEGTEFTFVENFIYTKKSDQMLFKVGSTTSGMIGKTIYFKAHTQTADSFKNILMKDGTSVQVHREVRRVRNCLSKNFKQIEH